MKILGIETSCDETAAAVVEDGVKILSNVVVSQIDIFAEYGGVIPEVAARSHLEVILPVINKALADADCTWEDIDAIAVTHAPGLLGSLLIGTLTARTLAILHNKPLYAVHHLKSHVYANWLQTSSDGPDQRGTIMLTPEGFDGPELKDSEKSDSNDYGGPDLNDTSDLDLDSLENLEAERRIEQPAAFAALDMSAIGTTSNVEVRYAREPVAKDLQGRILPCFPILALVVSGGHTQILYMPAHNEFEIIGTTRDDAVGECFDKVAKILGLPYPGGPSIAKAALNGDPDKYKLPHPKVSGLDFSFSGLKTAVLRAVQKEVGVPISFPSHKLKEMLNKQQVADFAASFQKTAVDILCERLTLALDEHPEVQSVVLAGGVSANDELRWALPEAFFPAPALSGDNGAMVAAACYFEIISGVEPVDPYKLNIYPRISIES